MKTPEPNPHNNHFSICSPEKEIDRRPRILRDLEAAGFDLDAVTAAINTSWPTWARRLLCYGHFYGLEDSEEEFLRTILERGTVSPLDLDCLDELCRQAVSAARGLKATKDISIYFRFVTSPPKERWRPPILRDLEAAGINLGTVIAAINTVPPVHARRLIVECEDLLESGDIEFLTRIIACGIEGSRDSDRFYELRRRVSEAE
jgi:hypothetical protein